MRPLILVGRPNHTRKTEEIRRSEAFMAKDEASQRDRTSDN